MKTKGENKRFLYIVKPPNFRWKYTKTHNPYPKPKKKQKQKHKHKSYFIPKTRYCKDCNESSENTELFIHWSGMEPLCQDCIDCDDELSGLKWEEDIYY